MKNIFKISVFISLATIVGAALFVFFTDKEVVVLKDGNIKTVDHIWESRDSLFYEINNEIYLLDKFEIKGHSKRNLIHLFLDIKARILNNFNKIKTIINQFSVKKGSYIDAKRSSPLILIVVLLFFMIILLSKKLLKINSHSAKKEKAEESPQESKDEAPTRLDIVRFFSNLFKFQVKADPDAPVEFVPLISKNSSPTHIFELRVKQMTDWAKRRMTIGPLGEDSGSKSKCYYVIYDIHMVVKIPVRPIVDFEEYIESIKKEVHIVNKLSPKECIIPKVSVILGLIHKFPYMKDYSSEKLEEVYINWLRKHTEYQEYLKINGSFAFFMDLSKYHFLGNIIDDLHDVGNSLAAEISQNAQIIWEPTKFKGRYGVENDAVVAVREVYSRCEADIRRLGTRLGIRTTMPSYQVQSWFFTHLAGQEVTADSRNYPEKFVSELNQLLRNLIQANSKVVETYRKTIKDFLHKSSFERNKLQMAAIISNLLDLLAWLREKRVSMRDLKPDNLFVAGDPDRYPLFLRSPNEFSLGIIDVETAVDFEKSKYKKTKQPLLGGTPYYATPSHFIKNDVILYKFKNLGKILHLQDWHATLVMIYKVVVGELLFEQTAKLFSDIKKMIIQANRPGGYQSDFFEEASRIFWRSAALEFQAKTNPSEKILRSVVLILPENVGNMFTKVLVKEGKSLTEAIDECVKTQTIFAKDPIRNFLLKSSSTRICQFKADLESKKNNSLNPAGTTTAAMDFLNKLEHLKSQSDRHAYLLKLLSQPEPKMTVYDITAFMFSVVLNNMYSREWKPLLGEAVGDGAADGEPVIEATIQC
jgi:serine/threonine protein kinase